MQPTERPTLYVGVDPGTSYSGVGVLRRAGGAPFYERWDCLVLRRVRGRTGDPDMVAAKVCGLLDQLALEHQAELVVAVEAPPKRLPADLRNRPQAGIGDSIGYIGGLVVGHSRARGWKASRCPVREWRETMLVVSARAGHHVIRPSKGSKSKRSLPPTAVRVAKIEPHPEGGWYVHPRGGGDPVHAPSYEVLIALGNGTKPWPGTAKKALTDREQVRDTWKEVACSVTKHLFAFEYAGLVQEAASKAKSVKPDYRYTGVADACEAAMIAMHRGTGAGSQSRR